MGGQNATLVVACLVLPGLMLVLTPGRTLRRRAGDVAAWGALVTLASLWWLVPLLLLGSYSPPFLDFIESAASTAGTTGWLSSLRGTSHWVAFFTGGGRWAGRVGTSWLHRRHCSCRRCWSPRSGSSASCSRGCGDAGCS